ncbi:MAG: hypothetical protein BAJALOKI2v1_50019 [Promethearchaeota archaeon]|nr:MAG: hypothetical protein BAJALOKI2v1_50019 [Candidatus Lokiarchaeota archaeon]
MVYRHKKKSGDLPNSYIGKNPTKYRSLDRLISFLIINEILNEENEPDFDEINEVKSKQNAKSEDEFDIKDMVMDLLNNR